MSEKEGEERGKIIEPLAPLAARLSEGHSQRLALLPEKFQRALAWHLEVLLSEVYDTVYPEEAKHHPEYSLAYSDAVAYKLQELSDLMDAPEEKFSERLDRIYVDYEEAGVLRNELNTGEIKLAKCNQGTSHSKTR